MKQKRLILIVVLIISYISSYLCLVTEKGYEGNPSFKDDPRAEIIATYRLFGYKLGSILFAPVHKLDKMLRPDTWHYVLVLKADDASPSIIRVQSFKELYYPHRPMLSVYSGELVENPNEWMH